MCFNGALFILAALLGARAVCPTVDFKDGKTILETFDWQQLQLWMIVRHASL
jgi:hypothetical protein